MRTRVETDLELQERLAQWVIEFNKLGETYQGNPEAVQVGSEMMARMAESLTEDQCQIIEGWCFQAELQGWWHPDHNFLLRSVVQIARKLRFKQN